MDGSNKDNNSLEQPNADSDSLENQPAANQPAETTVANTELANGDESVSLDATSSNSTPNTTSASLTPESSTDKSSAKTNPSKSGFLPGPLNHLNVYLLAFVLLLILAAASGIVLYLKAANQANSNSSLPSQTLSQSELSQLANSNVSVGGPQYTLNVQSNAQFAGNLLVRRNLQVAGSLQVASGLQINGLTVTGNSNFDTVQIAQSLAVTGNSSLQGQLNVQGPLNVNGSATFQGTLSATQITTGSLQLTGVLDIAHHVATSGGTPTLNYGSSLGSGGSASVNGTDTAGSVTINTAGNPSVGCFLTVNFTSPFSTTPHIVITPVGSGAAGLSYYINRTTTNFSICTASAPPATTTFGFDYIAFD